MIIVLLVFSGLIFGSFVNAFVWRLHEQERLREQKKPNKKQLEKLSILRGRSMCTHCGHELAAKDLIPVLSWLSLKGHCRYCQKPISWQYPLVELLTAGVFLSSYAFWPTQLQGIGVFQFVVWLFFVIAFMILAVYDIRWYLLPDRIVYPLMVVASADIIIVALAHHNWRDAWYPAIGAAILFGTFYLLFQISGGNWIGGGDVKLAFVLGLLAGSPLRALLVMFLASLIGTIVSTPMLLKSTKNFKAQVPFGPFLLLATAIVVLFGTNLANAYDKILLR